MILFAKAHNPGYTRRGGAYVAPFDDGRPPGKRSATPLPPHLHGRLFLVRHPSMTTGHSVAPVRSIEAAARHDRSRQVEAGSAVLVHAPHPDRAVDLALAWDRRAQEPAGAAALMEGWHAGAHDSHSFHYVRERE